MSSPTEEGYPPETKVAVITGASKGIGLAIVRGLCLEFLGVIYLTARNRKRGLEAVRILRSEGMTPKFYKLDITDQRSLDTFRDYLQQKYGGIDLLVNNAAIAFKVNAPDPVYVQAKQTLAVNYFAVVSMCDMFFPLLRKEAKVINVACSCGHLSSIPSEERREKLQDPNMTMGDLNNMMNDYIKAVKFGSYVEEWGNSSLAVSKVGLVALTKIQQKLPEITERGIKINAVNPGNVATDMSSHKGNLTVDEGAESTVFLAIDPEAEELQGEFVWHNKKIVSWDGKMPGK